MSPLPILEYPSPVLRKEATAVTVFDSKLRQLTEDLKHTLYSTSGIGLCAPQIGHSVQLFVIDLSDDQTEPQVYVNPKIIAKSGMAIAEERCLSIPGVAAKVIRSGVVKVIAQNVEGEEFERDVEGMSAICVQHELDHLQGTLFIDRVSRLRRFWFKQALRQLENKQKQTRFQAV